MAGLKGNSFWFFNSINLCGSVLHQHAEIASNYIYFADNYVFYLFFKILFVLKISHLCVMRTFKHEFTKMETVDVAMTWLFTPTFPLFPSQLWSKRTMLYCFPYSTSPSLVEVGENVQDGPFLNWLLLSLQIVPRYGPMNGHIMVTIKGSNLGIKKEDIKRITVAGEVCEHQADRYSVSTRYCIHKRLHLFI